MIIKIHEDGYWIKYAFDNKIKNFFIEQCNFPYIEETYFYCIINLDTWKPIENTVAIFKIKSKINETPIIVSGNSELPETNDTNSNLLSLP